MFTCGNGRCVPYHYRCDHYDDCGDNSDEAGCLFRQCDPNTEFACNNGRCIAKDYVCNGINNCYDNGTSDEQNCREYPNIATEIIKVNVKINLLLLIVNIHFVHHSGENLPARANKMSVNQHLHPTLIPLRWRQRLWGYERREPYTLW